MSWGLTYHLLLCSPKGNNLYALPATPSTTTITIKISSTKQKMYYYMGLERVGELQFYLKNLNLIAAASRPYGFPLI